MKTSTDFAAKRRAPQNFAVPQKKRARVLAPRLALYAGGASLLLFAAGCEGLREPDIKPVKQPLPTPTGPAFSPEDHITKGVALPGLYRVRDIISAELLTIEGVTQGEGGVLSGSGVFQTIRLAGIVAPQPGQRGWEGSVKTVRNWTQFNRLNPTIELEADSKFPIDLEGRAMMQVYFKGTAERTKGTRYNLNRMLVRSGWAVVDLNTATSIDLQQWMNDEEYARMRNLGLRKYGIVLGQRLPSPRAKTPAARRLGAGTSISVVTGKTTTTSATSRTSTTTAPSPGPGAMSPGVPVPPPAAGGNAVTPPMPAAPSMPGAPSMPAAPPMPGNTVRP